METGKRTRGKEEGREEGKGMGTKEVSHLESTMLKHFG